MVLIRPHKKITCLASTYFNFSRLGGRVFLKILPTNSTTGCFRNTILEIQHTTTVRTNFNMNTAFKTEKLQHGIRRVMHQHLTCEQAYSGNEFDCIQGNCIV